MKKIRNIFLSIFLLTAFAVAQPDALDSVKIDHSAVKAGQSLSGVVTLKAPAPAEGLKVELWTDNAASAPTYVFIPAGQTSAEFKVATNDVNSDTQVNVAALLPHSSAVSSFTIQPGQALVQK